jgi:hypothetical protein
MAVTKMMALISGGLSTIIDGHSRSPYRVNRERNGLHAPNTSNQNREGPPVLRPRIIPTPSPSIFVIKPISIIVTTLTITDQCRDPSAVVRPRPHRCILHGNPFPSLQNVAASMPATGGTHCRPLDPASLSLLPGNCPMQSNQLTLIPDLWHSLRINIRTNDHDQKTDHFH